jgi:hypothetical protein
MSISPVSGNDPSKWSYPYNPMIGGLDDPRITEDQDGNPLWKSSSWPGGNNGSSSSLKKIVNVGGLAVDCSLGDIFQLDSSLGGSITFTNFQNGQTIVLLLSSALGQEVTWPFAVIWPSNSVPLASGSLDAYTLLKINNSVILGVVESNYPQ